MSASHPHIEELRLYISTADSVSRETAERIEGHLAECAFCRDVVVELRHFTQIRQQEVNQHRVHEESEKLLDRILKGKRTQRRTIQLQPRPGSEEKPAVSNGRMVLAAASEEEDVPMLSAISTLYSADESVLLRILLDHEHSEYALYVLAEKKEHSAHVLIESPLSETPVMTDEDGICRLPADAEEEELDTFRFRIHPAIAEKRFTTRDTELLRQDDEIHCALEKHTCTVSYANGKLSLRLVTEDTGHNASYIGVRLGDVTTVHALSSEHISFDAPLPTAGDRLLLY